MDMVVASAFGLESIVAKDIERLGYKNTIAGNGSVTLQGEAEGAICRLNIMLRTSDRVYIKAGEFDAYTFDQLFDGISAIPWADILPSDAKIHVNGKSVKSTLSSVPDCQSIAKKAIVETMKKKYGYIWLPETGPKYSIDVNIIKDAVTILIDTTGVGLNKRGYRPISAEAPIRETLAAALIVLSGWRYQRPFADPMCGSGTLPIEAAMLGLNISPGVNRTFEAEEWGLYGGKLWEDAREEALDMVKRDRELTITGSDIDGKIIETANYHARLAGVESSIKFERRALSDFKTEFNNGCMIVNPPYGERLEDEETARKLYKEIGKLGKGLPSWGIFVITPDKAFEKIYGRPADKRRKLYNGRLECCYYQYFGVREKS